MQTIESFEEYVDPVRQVIDEMFLPALFGQAEPLPDELSELLTLTPAQGGLGIPDLTTEAPQQYSASKTFTKQHVESIKSQSEVMNTNEQLVEELKRDLRTLKAENAKSKIESIDASLNPEPHTASQRQRCKFLAECLTPQRPGLTLNKQEFRDSLRLRYNLPLQDLPSTCACGEPSNVSHVLSCKKGGFVTQRHDGLRNLLTTSDPVKRYKCPWFTEDLLAFHFSDFGIENSSEVLFLNSNGPCDWYEKTMLLQLALDERHISYCYLVT